MSLPAQPRPTSVVSKLMLSIVVVLAAVLVAAVYALWIEKSPPDDLTGSIDSGLPVNVQATSSYTYMLAQLVEARCGSTRTDALHAASEVEIAADPGLALQTLAEAGRRAATITTVQSCDYVISEIKEREKRATLSATKH